MYKIATMVCVTGAFIVFVWLQDLSYASIEFETYTNADYNFSIDYPSDWIANEVNLQPKQIVIFHPDPDEYEAIPSPAVVSVWNLLLTDKTLNVTEVDLQYGTKDTADTRIVDKNLTTLSGFPAIENTYYDYGNNQNLKAKEIFALVDNEIFFVFYNTHPGYFDEYLPIVNQMIRSFKIGPS